MTLILAMGNPQQAVMVSDRRFSNDRGFFDDERNKAATLHCLDGRAAVAFTGLAEIPGQFTTSEWMMRVLPEEGKPDSLLEGTVRRFCDRATQDIAKLPIPDRNRGITFLFAGYKYEEPSPRFYFWRITNCEGKDGKPLTKPSTTFQCFSLRESRSPPLEPRPSFLLTAGWTFAVGDKELKRLFSLVQEGKPASALVERAVAIIRKAADSLLSAGSIGKQCSSIVLPSDPSQAAFAAYHSSVVSYKSYSPNQVVCRGKGGVWSVMDPVMEFRDPNGRPAPMAVPKVKRNDPCPCGSGRKYKKCHGRPGGIGITFGPSE